MMTTTMRWALAAILTTLCASAETGLRSETRRHLQAESSCNHVTDETACYQAIDDSTGQPCEWCQAGAIPSECMSEEQAKLLPPAVFECRTPGIPTELNGRMGFLNVREDQSDFCDASSKSISGYIDIKGSDYDKEGEDKHLFFWMFEKRGGDADASTPFLVWLTGGPGCSSTLALLSENGPCSVNKDGATTSVNPYSWTESAHVLWLDQPAGVGFSYGAETDSNEAMISEDAYYFLQAFFKQYSEYAENPLFIVGESYAGHYAPAIAHRVLKGNQAAKSGSIHLNLAGLGVGNGLTDPEEQYKW